MYAINNSTSINGYTSHNGRRVTSQNFGQRRSANRTRVNAVNNSNENHERNERDRDEFIASFNLNITTASSPILVRNGIEKLEDDCYSANMVNRYFENTNPHNVDIHIKKIWKVNLR